MNDARKADRLRVVLLARYREPTMLDLREAECRDLSLGGMFVATARPSPRGGLIRFECESSGEGESFRGTARVVWQRSKPDPRGPAGMGVRFVHLEPASREALSKLVARVAQSPSSMPAPNPMLRAPATEARASVLPIVELNGGAQGLGGPDRSALSPPTLRGVAPEAGDDSQPANGLDRGAIRRASQAPDAAFGSRAPMAGRVRTDPPPNLVSNAERPRSERPPAAAPVADEPAWSSSSLGPRERTRLDGSGAAAARGTDRPPPPDEPAAEPFPMASVEFAPSPVKIIGNRALNATAPGLGGPAPSQPPLEAPPRSAGATPLNEASAAARELRSEKPGRSTLPESSPPRVVASERPGAERAAAAAVVSERPVATIGGERPSSDRPPARTGGSERPPASMRERRSREQLSDRPPAPGGIDVLRPQVAHLPSAPHEEPVAGSDTAPAFRGGASSGNALWRGQRGSTDAAATRTSWEPPPAGLTPTHKHAAHHAAEEAEILASHEASVPRLSPPRSPVPEVAPVSRRSWGGLMLWLVIGSGLIVAVVLSKLFGGAPPGLPEGVPEAAVSHGAEDDNGQLALRYRLVVLSDPPGAKVTVADSTLVAPAEFGLADMEKPIVVSAALDGRMATSVEIDKLAFAPRGDHFEHEIKLVLPPLEPSATSAQPSAPAPEAPAPAVPAPSQRPPRPEAVSAPRTSPAQTPASATTPPASETQPFGAPVLPDRPRAMPPLGAPVSQPGTGGTNPASGSADGSSLTVTPSAATGSLASVTGEPASGDPFKRATECLLRGDNACVIRELEPNARNAPELEMLIETYRATSDQRNAERHMSRYVNGFPTARRAGEYRRLLQRTGASPSSTPASAGPGTASTPPAPTLPPNPPAPPMSP